MRVSGAGSPPMTPPTPPTPPTTTTLGLECFSFFFLIVLFTPSSFISPFSSSSLSFSSYSSPFGFIHSSSLFFCSFIIIIIIFPLFLFSILLFNGASRRCGKSFRLGLSLAALLSCSSGPFRSLPEPSRAFHSLPEPSVPYQTLPDQLHVIAVIDQLIADSNRTVPPIPYCHPSTLRSLRSLPPSFPSSD